MTATFSQFVAEQDAKNSIQLNVNKWCYMLTDSLCQNYINYAIRGHQRAIDNLNYTYDTTDSVQSQYHQQKIDELKSGVCPIDYVIESGNKYHKVILVDGGGQRSVHCFIDKNTGEVYKSASWKSPAKGVRYDLRLIKDREWLFVNADWSGGYLYK
jgi:cellulose synthase/poly-beta-1,6-N-acetylglucosamine synthase-like glycosyltransferase